MLRPGSWGAGGRHAAWAVTAASLTLLLGIAVPWAGWYGIDSAGIPLGGAAAGALVLWGAGVRHAEKLALALALLAGGLLVEALASPPSEPVLAGFRSRGAIALSLVALAALGTVGGLAAAGRLRPPHPIDLRDPRRRRAAGVTWRAFGRSRVLVWAAAVFALGAFGIEESVEPPPQAVPFGEVGDRLTAPATAWDGGAYLQIAQTGYASGGGLQAFFPLYPTLVRFAAWSPQATVVSGILVALLAFAAALYLLHRLVSLEADEQVADRTVMLMAFSPMAVFFSAIYTESLFLLLSVGAFYAARRAAWPLAALAAALASATRPTGVLLLLPLVLLYARERSVATGLPLAWRHVRALADRRAWWLLAVPSGQAAYLLFCAAHGDLLAPVHALETFWQRGFGPLEGAVRGFQDTVLSLRQVLGPESGALPVPDYGTAGQLSVPSNLAIANLTDFAFLAGAAAATIGVLRRLPPAYGAYAVATILVTASTSFPYEPLASVPRYLMVLFPTTIWLAMWARGAARYRVVLVSSATLMIFFAGRFATWHWVA